tara:strand:- start:475 stop:840 length:366 start_codon:yes stop_codon:yes gene_type:complete
MGLIPFYLDLFFSNSYFDKQDFEKISIYYGLLIISFLSGMQWQRLIQSKTNNLLYLSIPMLNFIFSLTALFNFFLSTTVIVVIGLVISLLIDVLFQKQFLPTWFVKLRLTVTFFAIISYLI